MKKTSNYYFLAVLILSIVNAVFVRHVTFAIIQRMSELLGGKALPSPTLLAINFYWWPNCFVAASLTGLLISVFTRIKSTVLCHAAFIILAVEALATAVMITALCTTFSVDSWAM